MKYLPWLLLSCMLGCQKAPQAPIKAEVAEGDRRTAVDSFVAEKRDWIAEVKALAKKHHMRYRTIVDKQPSNPTWDFIIYVEENEGRLSSQHWVAGNGSTIEDAARELIQTFERDGFQVPDPPSNQKLGISGDFTKEKVAR